MQAVDGPGGARLDPTQTRPLLPTPTPTPPSSSSVALTREEMEAVLEAAGWPAWAIPEALAVSWCESRWRPGEAAWADQPDGRGSTGLFQLWSGWYAAAGRSWEDWADPLTNAAVALYVWERHGWAPWTCRP